MEPVGLQKSDDFLSADGTHEIVCTDEAVALLVVGAIVGIVRVEGHVGDILRDDMVGGEARVVHDESYR